MKMMKRVLSLLMCFIMLVGMLPMEAFAITTDENGTTVYEIGDSVWVRGEDNDPTEVCAPGTFWLPDYDENDQPVTRLGLCEKTEHAHAFVCPDDCTLAHEHKEDCYVTEYTGCTIHTHDESCAQETVYDCGKEQHENHGSCTASQKCILEEHDHAALNCPTGVRFTCETQEHTHSAEAGCPYETVFTCTEEHEHSVEAGCAQETVCTCTKAEHTHSVEAGCPNETVYTCGKENHAHSENCTLTTVYDCGKEIHVHDETCPTKQVYPNCVEHAEHNENCATEQKLNCGKDEHTCITEGCAADCAIEEHTHTAECDMESVYYKWTVVEDTSSTLESGRALPVHFFIAEPGQAINPDGSYVNYRTDLWGDPDNASKGIYSIPGAEDMSTIKSKNGIRNVSDEGLITPYVANYSQYADELKNFGSITIDRVNYSQTEYEIKWVTVCFRQGYQGGVSYACNCRNFVNDDGEYYDHIHVDGVLSKKILPAEMKLTKRIPANATSQETFNFTLTKLQHTSAGAATQNVDTSFGTNGSITLTATIPAGQSSASIVSPTGTEIGFGYYMLTENTNGRWQTSGIVIERSGYSADMNLDPGPVYIYIAPDGTLKYSSTYNGTYATANNIYVDNERKPLNVTYTWEGIPEGLTPLPENSTVAPGGSHAINTSYQIGDRVRGMKGIVDPADNTDTEGYYYEFMGWQYYDLVVGDRVFIEYNNGVMDPSQITNIDSDVNVHGLWTRHNLDTANGYITITKEFVGKPSEESLKNYYIAVIHDTHRTDISPMQQGVGTWNADGTKWTYNFAISESDTYTVVEGKYDVAGYVVDAVSSFADVTDISTGKAFTGSAFVSDGHNYTEIGQEITVTLPYDTSVLSDVAAQAENPMFYAGTVAFTNTYTKRYETEIDEQLPDLRVRKWDGNYMNLLNGAVYELTKEGETNPIQGQIQNATTIYENLAAGEYTLVETMAPDGYVKSDAVYNIQVVLDSETEELRAVCTPAANEQHSHTTDCYKYVKIQKYKIEVSGYDDPAFVGRYNPTEFRLNIPNEQIKADLNITKNFSGMTTAPASGTILVDVYGPVVKNDSGVVTAVGPLIRSDLVITGPEWKLTVEDLPYGEYFVEEIMGSLHGYTWNGVSYSQNGTGLETKTVDGHTGALVKVASTSNVTVDITNTYTQWQSADFYILKTDLSGNELAGAKFELFDESGTNVTGTYLDTTYSANGLTNSNGLVRFAGFTASANAPKIFTLKETVAPNGYYLTTNEYQVKVTYDGAYDIVITNSDGTATGAWNHDDDLLTVIDTPIRGQITVEKDFEFLDQLFNTVPDGTYVTFLLESKDGTYSRSASLTKTTGWSHTFTDLPLGEYTVKEAYASIDGHTYTTTHKVGANGTATNGAVATVNLTAGTNHVQSSGLPNTASATVTFENTYTRVENLKVTPTSFTVLKQGEDGEALPNATFTLFTDAACNNKLTAPVEGFTVEATTDAYGQAHFTGLKLPDLPVGQYEQGKTRSATYYLQETKAPENHVLLKDKVWTVTISENQIKINELNDDKTGFDTVIDWIAGIFNPDGTSAISGNVLTVTNQRIKGNLTITKAFVDDQGQALDEDVTTNARVEIHVHGPVKRENGQVTDIGPLVQTINLSGTNKTANVSNLEIGEYVMRETFASIHGYSWTHVSAGNGVTEVTVGGKQYAAFTVDAATPDISIGVTNTYKKWEAADFTIYKYRENADQTRTGLGNAKFELYEENATTPAYTATTDISGYATFANLTIPAADPDKKVTYYLKEAEAPDNHKKVDTVWEVTVSYDDTNGYDVKIKLKDSQDVTSAEGWSWNYSRDTLNVENEEILGKITVKKTFDGNMIPTTLESIKVELLGNGITRDPIVLNAGNSWTASFDNLPMGTYYVAEADANANGYTLTSTGYTVDGTSQTGGYATVVLTEGENRVNPDVDAEVGIRNKYTRNEDLKVSKASFKIKKVDEENPARVLPGAKFVLFAIDNGTEAQVAEATTDANGIAEFKNIPLVDKSFGDYTNTTGTKVTYILRETVAPAGYQKSDTAWTVELTESIAKVNELNADKSAFETIVEWLANVFKGSGSNQNELDASKTLTVSNKRIKGTLTVKKSFGGVAGTTALANARVEIHVHGPITRVNGRITDIGPLVKTVNLSNGDWDDVISNLEIGEYVVREPFASIHGYTWKDVKYFNGSSEIQKETAEGKGSDVLFAAFTIDANHTAVTIDVTNTYEEWAVADFYVNKVKSLDKLTDGLEGAKFKLYTDAACTIPAVRSDANPITVEAETGIAGYAHFTGFTVPAGHTSVTYYLKEVEAPNNYKKVDTIWKVEIKAVTDGSKTTYEPKITLLTDTTGQLTKVDDEWSWNRNADVLNVVNEEIKATLTITKAFDGDALPNDAFADSGTSAIKVKITGPNGYDETKTLALNAEGKLALTLTDLKLGTYTVTEDTVHAKVPGYDLIKTTYQVKNGQTVNTVEFTDATEEPSAEMVITNTYDRREGVVNNPDQFTIHKKDDAGDNLPGAKFRLTNDHNPAFVREFVTGVDGKVTVDNLIGIGTLTSSESINYTLEEIEAPTGHELSENRTWTIEVKENGGEIRVVLNSQNDTFETIWDWIIGQFTPSWNDSTKTLTVVNSRKTAEISVTKIVSGLDNAGDDDYIKNLRDAQYTFELYIDDVKQTETVTVKAGETKKFETKVPYGSTYEVKEVVAADAAFTSSLTNATGTVAAEDLNGITVTATNTYAITTGNDLVLDFIKVSTGRTATPLQGAKFELYDSKDMLMKSYTSGKDGKFKIEEIKAPGIYELIETAAPSGYYKLYSPITITASYDYKVDTTGTNGPVIVRSLVATVAGSTSYQVSSSNDFYYGIKNTPVTEVSKTSDETDLLFWGGMTTVSLLCMAIMLLIPRKKGKYQR